ncbi:triose-phosphate isomerase [Brumimicrobium aurantiacum]|uniref:Triosephosphate isomerase n=1 Tax=Brumimicrobium aurantiacum TaxID=1737063 RepID=A0A3E1EV81_9FLAO|nr:triose-phosphate isomerase [Brumimicrobium aurantiacum]RFC53465.1 triose-phosphate isomerase [Brumimicrobium aurantiacum]
MRKKIVAGNWKMNLSLEEGQSLHKTINSELEGASANCEVYHFTPSIYLTSLINEDQKVQVGAQNGHPEKSGAFTGEISMSQLKAIGTQAVLIGHSERRQLFNESDSFLKEKVDAALSEGLKVFFCCGESLEQRENGDYNTTVVNQLKNALFHLDSTDFQKIVIAYEPIWAIGTGKTASPEQANEMHQNIRKSFAHAYSKEIAEDISILYGGSCKPSNASDLLTQSDIDGGLIGGASLKAEDFLAIISTYK